MKEVKIIIIVSLFLLYNLVIWFDILINSLLLDNLKKILEGFANTGPLPVQFGNILRKVFHCARYVAFAHTIITINMVTFLAII
jgi:hypothetical protein